RALGEQLYAEQSPAQRLYEGVTHSISDEKDGTYKLSVALPFVEKDDLDLYRSRDELTLRVGPYRRNIVLPHALWNLEIADAKFDKSTLNIRFEPAATG
ncbi:MAG: hypothetical protein AAGK74_14690, partial [Chloroflexota bacterium]